jgi:translocation and assembly module TamB
MDLAAANSLLLSSQESLQGEIAADLQIPRLDDLTQFSGLLRLNHGSYENRQLGLLTTDIHLFAERPQNNRSIIISAQANDGQAGSYHLKGSLPWPPEQGGDHTLRLTLDNAAVKFRDALTGKTSGTLALSHKIGHKPSHKDKDINIPGKPLTYSTFTLAGDIQLQPTFITLDNLSKSDITTLNPDQIKNAANTQPNIPSATFSQTDNSAPPIFLDINIVAPQQAFLRGRGLEAELQGELRLTGTLRQPNLKGLFTGIRGNYKIFARKFMLTESQVQIDGDNIVYRLTAEHKRSDVQILANLTGSQESVDVAFSSVPELPKDEIIAFLLFGKSIDSITPAQAVQLAGALQQLGGSGGGGFDPLGKTREMIQVDTLTLESQETEDDADSQGGLTIGVGKYINDKVYVEFLKDSADAKSWRTNIEVEIAPSLDLKTNAESGRGFSGIELQWRRDY